MIPFKMRHMLFVMAAEKCCQKCELGSFLLAAALFLGFAAGHHGASWVVRKLIETTVKK